MKLKPTKHFEDMLQYRGVDIDHVKSAIREPDKTDHSYGGKTVVRKDVGGRKIEVVYYKNRFREKSNEYVVITAYYL